MLAHVVLSALALLPTLVGAHIYHIAKDYSGASFFDDWIFFNNFDNLTNGRVNYLGSAAAAQQKLAFVNDAGNAVMRVDNTTLVKTNQNRNSIRVTTKDQYAEGSLWIADIAHVPYGCSTWPAWWSQALNWPTGGEIDSFEGVNMITNNHISLHTEPGCFQVAPNQTSTIVNTTDCSYLSNDNSGCSTFDPSNSSYGAAFAGAGGGMFVTEFAHTGISVWFFNRANIPNTLTNNASTIDVDTLGIPVANWPPANCSVETFFEPQSLIFDITLCGDYAGMPSVFAETCPGDCYADWVLGAPSNFDNAYFEVRTVQVFNNGTNTTIVGSIPPSSIGSPTSGGGGVGDGGGIDGGPPPIGLGGAQSWRAGLVWVAAVVAPLALLLVVLD